MPEKSKHSWSGFTPLYDDKVFLCLKLAIRIVLLWGETQVPSFRLYPFT